jgi:hypothetical protein
MVESSVLMGPSTDLICPRCHSNDVKRSRRTFTERLVLPMLRGRVFRCRDCKKRFWIDVQWSAVILAGLSMTVAAGIVTAAIVVHQMRVQEAAAAAKAVQIRRYRVRPRPMPRGLPPLSSIPRPGDDTATTSPTR